jgi:hypothetical protein
LFRGSFTGRGRVRPERDLPIIMLKMKNGILNRAGFLENSINDLFLY